METMSDFLIVLEKIIGVIIIISFISILLMMWSDRFTDRRYRKRLKIRQPVWLDMGKEGKSGWYVVKKIEGDRVELVRPTHDSTKKNIDLIPTEKICKIEQLYKYDRKRKS